MNSCFIISLCLSSTFSFFISIFITEAAPEYLFHDCPNTTLFTPSSTYRSNLRILLSSLSSAAIGSADGFANAAAGQNPPDRAYGSSSAAATSTAPCAATAWPLGNGISSKDARTSKSPQSGMTSACCGTRTGSSSWPWSNRRIGSNLRHELYPFYNASALRLPAPPLPAPAPPPPAPVTGPEGKSIKFAVIIIVFALAVFTTLVFLFLVWCIRRKNATKTHAVVQGDQIGLTEITNSESLRYNLATILVATNNFSHQNKLGNGGFGEVFLGMLLNGVLIAVKRLSQLSRQGAEEFKNEVMLLPKLQHRNVVQLLGFCLEGAEKVLIYEFVQNKSLDYFLFDPERSRHLNWSTRYKIACGIARGMCYLHDDSRIRVIHRDLKSSNILLDNEMNPKISDFGMARIFGVNQTLASTERIAGTYGYMSPEYAMNGQFSVKSDVYSFGILLMELVSGKKNGSFYQEDGNGGIAIHAWKNWRGGTPLAVLDPVIGDAYSMDEVLGCLRIGLLCTLEDPNQRPTMASIVCELSSLPITLELPQRPAFFPSRTQRMTEELESDKSTGRSIPTWYRVSSL